MIDHQGIIKISTCWDFRIEDRVQSRVGETPETLRYTGARFVDGVRTLLPAGQFENICRNR